MPDNNLQMIPVEKLYPHPDNPRKDLGDLTELTNSIREKGVMQNLTVVPAQSVRAVWDKLLEDPDRTDPAGAFVVVIGHRRCAAAKLAGLSTLPCAVTELSPQDQVAVMLMENMQRSDLTKYEEAMGFQQLMLDFGQSVTEVAKLSGLSEPTIRKRVKLLDLDRDKFLAAEARGGTLADYAKLDSLKDPENKNAVLDCIGTRNFENAYRRAVYREKNKELLDKWEEQAAAFATKIEDVDYSTMSSSKIYYTYQQSEEVKQPQDAGIVPYYYKRNPDSIWIFTDRKEQSSPEELEKAREKEAHEALMTARKESLKEITSRHFELRWRFVKNLTWNGNYLPALLDMAADTIMGEDFYGTNVDFRLLGKVMGGTIENLCKKKFVNQEEFLNFKNSVLESRKSRYHREGILLRIIYAAKDGERRPGESKLKYWGSQWNEEKLRFEITHLPEPELDKLYAFLCACGYEMSDEERQMQGGTHELFQEIV